MSKIDKLRTSRSSAIRPSNSIPQGGHAAVAVPDAVRVEGLCYARQIGAFGAQVEDAAHTAASASLIRRSTCDRFPSGPSASTLS
jgi:hypothetical protein